MSKPNILFITTDQQRWDFYDNQYVRSLRTRNISRLKQEGTALPNSVANCPICIPARFTWTHGIYASQGAADLLSNCHDWPTGLDSMPRALQQAGYYTALVGKLHSHEGLYHRDVSSEASQAETLSRGFDHAWEVCGKSLAYWFDGNWTHYLARKGLIDRYRKDLEQRLDASGGYEPFRPGFLDPEDTMDGYIGRQASQWIRQYKQHKPWFLHASFCGPHFPIDPPKCYFDRYDPDDMPPPEGVTDPGRIKHWQQGRAAYCAAIELIDDQVGNLLTALSESGFADNTLILFTTDHGDMIGHHDQKGKGPPYDTSIRTPCVAWWPGQIPANQQRRSPVEAVDVPATIMDAAGLGPDPTKHIDSSPGRSFLGYLTGADDSHRDWAYSEQRQWRLVREQDWKYVASPKGDQLFDLRDDPWEMNNRIDDPAMRDRVRKMQRQLIESMFACVRPSNISTRPRDDWFRNRGGSR
jgi:choline-sulfatase